MSRMAIVGGGAMGSAFVRGIISAGLYAAIDIVVTDVDQSKLDRIAADTGVAVTKSNSEAVLAADVVLLAIKPGIVAGVCSDIADMLVDGKLVISIAAGVSTRAIESNIHASTPVIRAMPNTPCQIRAGAVVYCRGRSAMDEHAALAKTVLESVGVCMEVPESMLDAVTALSGSGPAYVYLIIEALSDAGVACGLTRDVSSKLAAQTVYGSAKMVITSGLHPAVLKEQVTSPGGTTIAGLGVLEREGVRSALMEAVKAARDRSRELASS
jgi:pyrroline-5-carboxylate reductase